MDSDLKYPTFSPAAVKALEFCFQRDFSPMRLMRQMMRHFLMEETRIHPIVSPGKPQASLMVTDINHHPADSHAFITQPMNALALFLAPQDLTSYKPHLPSEH